MDISESESFNKLMSSEPQSYLASIGAAHSSSKKIKRSKKPLTKGASDLVEATKAHITNKVATPLLQLRRATVRSSNQQETNDDVVNQLTEAMQKLTVGLDAHFMQMQKLKQVNKEFETAAKGIFKNLRSRNGAKMADRRGTRQYISIEEAYADREARRQQNHKDAQGIVKRLRGPRT